MMCKKCNFKVGAFVGFFLCELLFHMNVKFANAESKVEKHFSVKERGGWGGM
jgi:hypothetical protein